MRSEGAMTALAIHALIAIGLANILVHEGILDPIRSRVDARLLAYNAADIPTPLRLLRKLTACAACTSFWTGAAVSILVLSPTTPILQSNASSLAARLGHPAAIATLAAFLDGVLAHAIAVAFFAFTHRTR